MHDTIRIEAAAVAAQVANLLTAYPEMTEDGQLLLDMIEAETDIDTVASRILDGIAAANGMVVSISTRRIDMKIRQERFDRQSKALLLLLKSLMGIAGIDKLMLPEATVSVTKGRESVVITDPDAVPSQLCKLIYQPDKDAIGKALKAGETIPGAALVAGEAGLTVRVR